MACFLCIFLQYFPHYALCEIEYLSWVGLNVSLVSLVLEYHNFDLAKTRQNNDILELVKLIKHYAQPMTDPLCSLT